MSCNIECVEMKSGFIRRYKRCFDQFRIRQGEISRSTSYSICRSRIRRRSRRNLQQRISQHISKLEKERLYVLVGELKFDLSGCV